MNNDLGNRMKEQYENRTRYFLPRRTYTIIRLDGKAFSSFTRGLERPYDTRFISAMDYTAEKLCAEVQGCKLAYTQSDEISLLLTDFETITTQAYFDGNLQKIASVSSSIATVYFNQAAREFTKKKAMFDSRVFIIPDPIEVENYFIWRQQDATRNSISMTAQSLYSHKELKGKDTNDMQEMSFQKGVNWDSLPDGFKKGRLTTKEYYDKDGAKRSRWTSNPALRITKQREEFTKLIPSINTNSPTE